jgi:hypothetical protein
MRTKGVKMILLVEKINKSDSSESFSPEVIRRTAAFRSENKTSVYF